MITSRLERIIWPVSLIVAALAFLLRALGAIPDYIWDLIARFWPVLLIIFGLASLFGRRSRVVEAAVIAVPVAFALVVALAGYAHQGSIPVEAVHAPISQEIGDVVQVVLTVNLELSDLDLSSSAGDEDVITGEFIGPAESVLETGFATVAGLSELSLTERWAHPIPILDDFGHGRLTLSLPPVTAYSVDFYTRGGDVNVDLTGLDVRQMELRADAGDLRVILPEAGTLVGNISTGRGDLTLVVPESMAVHLDLNRGPGVGLRRPRQLDLLVGDILESDGYEGAQNTAALNLGVTIGSISVEITPVGQ